MTENDTDEIEAEPEMNSFEITSTRHFEVDFSDGQIAQLLEQTGAETPENALAQITGENERNKIAPEEKLLGVDVTVDGPSDD